MEGLLVYAKKVRRNSKGLCRAIKSLSGGRGGPDRVKKGVEGARVMRLCEQEGSHGAADTSLSPLSPNRLNKNILKGNTWTIL